MKRTASQAVIGPSCRGCMYLGYLHPKVAKPDFCNYLGIVGHSRGCPAGAGCAVKKLSGGKPRRAG